MSSSSIAANTASAHSSCNSCSSTNTFASLNTTGSHASLKSASPSSQVSDSCCCHADASIRAIRRDIPSTNNTQTTDAASKIHSNANKAQVSSTVQLASSATAAAAAAANASASLHHGHHHHHHHHPHAQEESFNYFDGEDSAFAEAESTATTATTSTSTTSSSSSISIISEDLRDSGRIQQPAKPKTPFLLQPPRRDPVVYQETRRESQEGVSAETASLKGLRTLSNAVVPVDVQAPLNLNNSNCNLESVDRSIKVSPIAPLRIQFKSKLSERLAASPVALTTPVAPASSKAVSPSSIESSLMRNSLIMPLHQAQSQFGQQHLSSSLLESSHILAASSMMPMAEMPTMMSPTNSWQDETAYWPCSVESPSFGSHPIMTAVSSSTSSMLTSSIDDSIEAVTANEERPGDCWTPLEVRMDSEQHPHQSLRLGLSPITRLSAPLSTPSPRTGSEMDVSAPAVAPLSLSSLVSSPLAASATLLAEIDPTAPRFVGKFSSEVIGLSANVSSIRVTTPLTLRTNAKSGAIEVCTPSVISPTSPLLVVGALPARLSWMASLLTAAGNPNCVDFRTLPVSIDANPKKRVLLVSVDVYMTSPMTADAWVRLSAVCKDAWSQLALALGVNSEELTSGRAQNSKRSRPTDPMDLQPNKAAKETESQISPNRVFTGLRPEAPPPLDRPWIVNNALLNNNASSTAAARAGASTTHLSLLAAPSAQVALQGSQSSGSNVNGGNSNDESALDSGYLDRLQQSLTNGAVPAFFHSLPTVEPSAELVASLRPYQQEALNWMVHREMPNVHETIHLPAGWTEHTTSTGKVYYLNEQNRQTQWTYPYDAWAQEQDRIRMRGDLSSLAVGARGGILADDMGMGKTIQMISLITSNRKSASTMDSESSYSAATLVVTPLSVLQQWANEITNNTTKDALKVYIYHGADRVKSANFLAEYDVVLTTFATLAAEYNPKSLKASPLFAVPWYRVVLDEAHTIKDKSTRTAKAACTLDAERRWVVTGTPIQNRLSELYSLLHFLHVSPLGEEAWWSHMIMRPIRNHDERGLQRLQTALSMILLRRTKDQRTRDASGQIRAVVDLPPRAVTVQPAAFSAEEQAFYDALWEQSKNKFNRLVEDGTVLQNYAHILELLLRLRQACDHPALVLNSQTQPDGASANASSSPDVAQTFEAIAPRTTTRQTRSVTRQNAPSSHAFLVGVSEDDAEVGVVIGEVADEQEGAALGFDARAASAAISAPLSTIDAIDAIETGRAGSLSAIGNISADGSTSPSARRYSYGSRAQQHVLQEEGDNGSVSIERSILESRGETILPLGTRGASVIQSPKRQFDNANDNDKSSLRGEQRDEQRQSADGSSDDRLVVPAQQVNGEYDHEVSSEDDELSMDVDEPREPRIAALGAHLLQQIEDGGAAPASSEEGALMRVSGNSAVAINWNEEHECSVCLEPISSAETDSDSATVGDISIEYDQAVIAPCSHLFCRGCLAKFSPDRTWDQVDEELLGGGQASVPSHSSFDCPICDKKIQMNDLKPVMDAYGGSNSCMSSTIDASDIPSTPSLPILARASSALATLHTVAAAPRPAKAVAATSAVVERFSGSFASSTKIDALLAHLVELRKDTAGVEKSIVFSQWTSMLDLLEKPLTRAGFNFVRLDGTMTQAQREASIASFKKNSDCLVFLISMKAGGLGLNLTEANHVFILDPWWSPSIEAQAIDRVHRIGQTRPVSVTRFVIKNSIEERILELQERKQRLAKSVLGNKSELKGISLQDLRILFS